MIKTRKIRQLNLLKPLQLKRPPYLTAASGLVHHGQWLYVVADDENHIAVFSDRSKAPGKAIRVFEGDLPLEKNRRKKKKPDLESLVRVTHPVHAPYGALLLVPSGSKSHRVKGALVPFDKKARILSKPKELDFTSFMNSLPFEVPNLEAAAVCGPYLCLLNRGNKKNEPNALLLFDLKKTLEALLEQRKPHCKSVKIVELGKHGEVPFTFTDASAVGDQLVFTAAAENTDDSYEDGPTTGAAIGILTLNGKIVRLDTLSPAHKVEGISARRDGKKIRCLIVNDEDDPAIASSLLECSF